MCSVWVERLDVTGFKRLAGVFTFDPGLTLVVGPNEAGKSSLGEAFIRSLWGFQSLERRRKASGSRWERCRPWDNRPWRMVATLVDHDGRRLRAEWDCAEHKVRLLDAVTGEDLSSQVAAKHGDVSLGSFMTGVSFADFRDVCLFNQHTLSEVQRSDSLVSALQQSVETAQADVGMAGADGRLKEFLKNEIGARSDSYNPLAAGPLQSDLSERADLHQRLEAAHAEEQTLAGLAQQLHTRQLQRDVVTEERLEIERAIRTLELREAKTLHSEALRQHDLATASLDVVPPLDERLFSAAREGFGAIEQADRAIVELERTVTANEPEVIRLRSEEEVAAGAVEALQEVADLDRSAEAEVRNNLAALGEVEEPAVEPPPVVPNPDPRLARYRDLRAELLELATRPEIEWNVPRLVAAVVVALVSLGVGLAVSPVGFGGVLLAAARIASARSVRAGAALAARLEADFGGEQLDDLERRAREEDEALVRARASAEAAEAKAAQRAARREELAAALTSALDRISRPSAPLVERAERYLDACRQRGELQEREALLSEIRRQLVELTAPGVDLASRREERERQHSALQKTLGELEIDASNLTTAREALDSAERARRDLAERRANAQGAQEALDTLLAGRTMADLEREIERAAQRLREHENQHPEVALIEGDLPDLRPRLAEMERRLTEASQLAAGLQAQIAERESRLPNVPELRERAAALDAAIERRQIALEAIRTAREALAEAARQAHRNFAPHLQRALERTLPSFTSNRYRDVTIADDLSISVIAPETGSQVPADCLSFGTQDQIYLVQRLEIAKMLIPTTGPVPLLLDEPFAEFDEERERSAVQLLCQEAEERQVVVFSHDRRLADLVTEIRDAPHLIELDGPPADVLAA